MRYRMLGETGIEVSALAFGCWGIVGGFNWGPQDEADSLAALRAAFDAGVNFFDTAEAYGEGESERMLGKALGAVRDEVVIASKVKAAHYAPDDLRRACERSLRALGTDRIDLYQLHWPHPEIPVEETMGAMNRLREEGKIRAVGVSNFGTRALPAALAAGPVVADQLAYSLLFRAIEYAILPLCRERNVGVLCYSSLMQGLLAGKFADADAVPDDRARTRHFASTRPQARHGEPGCEAETFAAVEGVRAVAERIGAPMADVSLAWLLAREGVTAVIAGARNERQARRNARAADLRLDGDALRALDAATAPLKARLGDNADMWQGDSRVF